MALKWAIAELFQEYLCWKPFVVKTKNNPLTYILTTPNLDATWHHWVESLAGFTFSIQYQKERDNAVVDALSHVELKLSTEAMKSILDGVMIGTAGRADAHDPVMAEANESIHRKVEETIVQAQAAHTHINLHVTDWIAPQQEDTLLKIVMEWIAFHKAQDLKHLLGDHATIEDSVVILREWKKFMLHQGAIYHCDTPAGELEEAMQFVVPMAHRVAAMNGCHRDMGHQGQWQTLSLLQDQFWWSAMAMQMQKAISSCEGSPASYSGYLSIGTISCGFYWH